MAPVPAIYCDIKIKSIKVFRKYGLKMWSSNVYILAPLLTFSFGGDLEEEKYGVKYASNCEVCKVWIFLDQVSMSILKWKVNKLFKCVCNGNP